MYFNLIKWLESHMGTCFYKRILGIDCPGCGMQRALINLLKGNIWESLKDYPALTPIIIMFIYLALHIIFKFKNGALILKISFIFTTPIIITNFIYKLLINNI